MIKKKSLWIYILVYPVTIAVCILLLVLSACVPGEKIQKNCEKSAMYFKERSLYPNIETGKDHTKLDFYADCILLNIVYSIDEKRPFCSVIEDRFYEQENRDIETSLMKNVFEEVGAESDYSRYWHGSIVFLRPMLCFTDIEGIYRIIGWVFFILLLAIEFLLIRGKDYEMAVIYPIALWLVSASVVVRCIEYSVPFLLMQIMIILFLILGEKRDRIIFCLCAVSGVLVSFMDFLTAETITITVPLFFVWMKRKKTGSVLFYIKAVCLWGIGYVSMFLTKWGISALFLGRSVLSDTVERAIGRMEGTAFFSVAKNIYTLFPISEFTAIGIKAVCVCLFAGLLAVTAVMIRQETLRTKEQTIAGALTPVLFMTVPYLRYVVLGNHSYLHSFFTYRAQLITILVMLSYAKPLGSRIVNFLRQRNS